MSKGDALPPGVGPHEDRELELMLSGKKPVAMFGDAFGSAYEPPEADFAPYVADGTIIRWEAIYRPPEPGLPCWFVYFARAGEEWRIDALHRINEGLFVHRERATPDTERKIGRLLGYTDAEIDQFLRWTGREVAPDI